MRALSTLLLLVTLVGMAGLASAQTTTHVAAYADGDVQGMTTIDGLNFNFATAVSPDGKHVYTCGGNGGLIESDNALVVFARDPATGELTFVEAEFDDDDSNDPGTADGLFGCRDVLVSPDGKHVYTAAFSEGEIGVFARDAASGAVSFSAVVKDGVGLDGLAGVEALAISPDGASLFAVGSLDDALVAFTRDGATGALTFEDAAREGLGGVSGLDRPVAVAVSPDGGHVYTAAGSNENFAGSDALGAFGWNAPAGALTFVGAYFEGAAQGAHTIDGLDRVSSVLVSPDGRHVYAAGSVDFVGNPPDLDWIAIFARDGATGALTWLDAVDDFNFCSLDVLFQFETYLVTDPRGDIIHATSDRTALTTFARDPDTGALTFMDGACFFDDLSLGINLPKKLSLDPSGAHVYVPGTASDTVSVFEVHPLRGLSPREAAKAAEKCQAAIAKAGARFVKTKLKTLDTCVQGILKCLQTKGTDKVDACVGKARGKCDKGLAKLFAKEEAKLASSIVDACAVAALVDPDDLRSDEGLGFALAEAACGSDLDGVAAIAACVLAEKECAVERALEAEVPRALDLMQVAGVRADLTSKLSCLTSLGGGDEGFGDTDPKGDGKAIDKCAKAITKAGSGFIGSKLKGLEQCLEALFKCVQTKPRDVKCLASASKKCGKQFDAPGTTGKITKAADKLRAAIQKTCGDVAFAGVLGGPAGLRLEALADTCAELGVPSLDDVEDYAECLFRRHECLVDGMVAIEIPRASELLSVPDRVLTSEFCPAP